MSEGRWSALKCLFSTAHARMFARGKEATTGRQEEDGGRGDPTKTTSW